MFAEAGAAHEAVRAQLSDERFARLGAELRKRPPRAVATCARGSSDHAATFAKYLIETRAGVLTASVAPSVASLYHAETALKDTLFLVISQSGASPDLIAAAERAKAQGAFVLGLINAENAPIAAVAHEVIPLQAGREASVAATKSFLASLAALIGLIAHWTEDHDLHEALARAPDLMQRAWQIDWTPARDPIAQAESLYVVGRGLGLGPAQEAALKLKETSRLHAEAYSAAEVRHGPMALVREGFPALIFAQSDEAKADVAKLASDMADRGAAVFLAGAAAQGATPLHTLTANPVIEPLLLVQSFYRLAHDIALARGCDPDRPPHLQKVTETL
jgi:glucosamine--fructose-6-phosphate aminotransferase (isomerizing)